MHVKLTTSGGRRYVQLVESYRDEVGRVKKRTVATLFLTIKVENRAIKSKTRDWRSSARDVG